jgi:hypothetical protein
VHGSAKSLTTSGTASSGARHNAWPTLPARYPTSTIVPSSCDPRLAEAMKFPTNAFALCQINAHRVYQLAKSLQMDTSRSRRSSIESV